MLATDFKPNFFDLSRDGIGVATTTIKIKQKIWN
jgi:hypothetical protein